VAFSVSNSAFVLFSSSWITLFNKTRCLEIAQAEISLCTVAVPAEAKAVATAVIEAIVLVVAPTEAVVDVLLLQGHIEFLLLASMT
jgi:hypothetical protein